MEGDEVATTGESVLGPSDGATGAVVEDTMGDLDTGGGLFGMSSGASVEYTTGDLVMGAGVTIGRLVEGRMGELGTEESVTGVEVAGIGEMGEAVKLMPDGRGVEGAADIDIDILKLVDMDPGFS